MRIEADTGKPAPNSAAVGRSQGPFLSRLVRKVLFTSKLAVALGVLLGAFWLGGRFGTPPQGLRSEDTERLGAQDAVEYWTCSMHPQIQQAKPGNCPICGMELVPVKKVKEAPKTKKVKYACAMMCLPPLDRPGKCPVCGMDMVPVEEHEGGEGTETEPSAPNAWSEISLSETARKLARLETAPVERRFVAADIRMVGKVDFDETRQRTISSRVPGRLDRLYVDYAGVSVQKGDHLVDLYSPELLAAQAELIQSYNAFHEPKSDASADLRRLHGESWEAARQKLLLWGLTNEQVQEIERRGAPSDRLTIYAPIGGIVMQKRLVEGAYVEEGSEIYTIADLSRVWVKLDAYERDLAWLRYGQDVEFTTEAFPGELFHGTIAFIDPVLNDRTRTTKVRVNVSNLEGRLKPAMFVRAVVRANMTASGTVMHLALKGKWICPMHPEVVADAPDDCTECGMPLVPAESLGYASESEDEAVPPLVIPVTAPLITGVRAIVYVARPDQPGRYQGREVVLGARAGEFYLVREGLAEGELVVTQGNLYVDSAAQILAKKSMMSPQTGANQSHGDMHHD